MINQKSDLIKNETKVIKGEVSDYYELYFPQPTLNTKQKILILVFSIILVLGIIVLGTTEFGESRLKTTLVQNGDLNTILNKSINNYPNIEENELDISEPQINLDFNFLDN